MKKTSLISTTILVMFFTGTSLFAQKYSTSNSEKQKVPISIFGNYISQGIYPGFRVGIEQPLLHKNYSSKNGNILKYKEQAAQYSFGFYHHGGFHTNFFLTTEYVFRRINKNGFIREFKPGLAISRTFLGATTYEADNIGNVNRIGVAGDFYFMPSLNFGLGKDLGLKKPNLPLTITTNLNLSGLLPYNGLILPTPMLKVGVRYKLTNKINVQTKTINKQHKSK